MLKKLYKNVDKLLKASIIVNDNERGELKMKSVYSLVLSDEVIKKVDEAAFKNGVSRSQFINEILAESVGVDTKRKRISDIYDEIGDYIATLGNLRVERRQQSSFDFLGALDYKYNPRVTYSVDLFGDDYSSGELKIALRTTNPLLLTIISDFFNDFISVERAYDDSIVYAVRDGKLIRKLNFLKINGKSISVAITDYITYLDKLLNFYVSHFGEDEKQTLMDNYDKVRDKMSL